MENPVLSGLRCLRTRTILRNTSISRCSNLHSSAPRAAQSIRSYSTPTINSPRTLARSTASCPSSSFARLRFYSSESSPSTIKGTVGEGAHKLEVPSHLDEAEKKIWGLLYNELAPTKLQVQDISGGCGSMYGIEVVSEKFRGLNMLKQQRLVNKILGEEIKGWHGVQLRTSVP
ncbi:putative bolA like protein [Botrytis fragariae]|uniref:Putative bolA like protein n=1 Tax=Botrytis fragariae TaxID=1964551 RepID=A0A8H6AUK9_9HELO|nr:putative bolA like protein [Botrytis fragariae]KAF5874088.1 putative bolA like protein [Botrytis fragariae]